ncbi:hypothetical protein PHYBOEH_003321 [Phytophthora boehmeriae]|uniref:Uncharacterized protein n=1 Tax=Phytophthora boehmeriae TaxID=109152 RepID=A0A8T1WQI5_9STRA|nr:hypothetical protein PHYBOEH_003321 [Phytophthora boehmeriae]
MTYSFLTKGTMPFYVAIWSLTGTDRYRFYGFVFGLVGGMHAVQLLRLLCLSITARRLVFQSDIGRPLVARRMSTTPTAPTSASSRLYEAFAHTWNQIFSRRGLFGVESEHFSTVSMFREVLEASSQTYQAYRASYLMPRAEMNSLIVALLVINCWSTAATQFFLRKSPALERVITLGNDSLISLGIMIIVPLIIFIPYVQQFDIKSKFFTNPEYLFDPVTIANMVLENRLIFAAGLFDFGTKLIPQLSIFLSLVTVSELIGRGDGKVIPGAGDQRLQTVAVRPKKTSTTDDGNAGAVQKPLLSKPSERFEGLHTLYKWKQPIVIGLFILWGVIILLLHGLAAQRAANYETLGCRAEARPWFSNGKEPCSSLVFNCATRNIVSLDDTSFDGLDHEVLSTLVIAHCPALRMPSDFQSLENLMMLHIYNSTIVSWDIDSSVSATAHTRMLSVLIGRTRMTEFPQGLLQPLPAAMLSIQFSETNLTVLPDDLYKRWHAMAAVSFENGMLTEIPYQMFFMPLYTLSFSGNRIETIPTLAMMPPGMIIPELRLDENPLRELPATLMAPNAFVMSLNVQATNVTTLPDWVKTQTKVVWAYDTPLCPMTDPTLAYQVMCFPRPAMQEAYFPMALFERLYPVDGSYQIS